MDGAKNVILITIDTLRKDVCTGYNHGTSYTPFLDSIRDNCIIFEDAKAAGPYTQASFPGILTSSYYLEYGKPKGLPKQKVMISELLQRNNVTTAAFHSNAYLSYYFGYNRGWDMFYDSMQDDVTDMYPFIRGDGINRKVEAWLTGYAGKGEGKNLFLWVHYMDVHEPYIAEDDYLQQIDPAMGMSKDDMFNLFKNIIIPRDVRDPEKVQTLKKLYLTKVMEVDGYLKHLFAILDNSGLLSDSEIIITSDHGDEFGEHGGLSHDGKMYSELIDVPMYLYNQKRTGMEYFKKTVSGVDIPPTTAAIFGVEPPKEFKGRSVLPSDGYKPDGCYSEAMDKSGHKEKDTDRPVYAFCDNNFKVIYRSSEKTWELYDLSKDPEEKQNIVEESNAAESMKERLLDTMKSNKSGSQ